MTSEYLTWTKPIFHFSQWKDNQTTRVQQNAQKAITNTAESHKTSPDLPQNHKIK